MLNPRPLTLNPFVQVPASDVQRSLAFVIR